MEERYESDLAQAERVLDGVDRALDRLNEGKYGTCETCGAPIRAADLESEPTRRLCEQHLAIDQEAIDRDAVPDPEPDLEDQSEVTDAG